MQIVINNLFTLLFFLQQHCHSAYIQSAMKSAGSSIHSIQRLFTWKKITLQTKNAIRNILVVPFGQQQFHSNDKRSCHLKLYMLFASGSLSVLSDVSKWCPLCTQCHNLPQKITCLSLTNSSRMINGGICGKLLHASSEQRWTGHLFGKGESFQL